MASSTHNPSVLLKRILSLTEPAPLLLVSDTLAQSSYSLVQEVIHNVQEYQKSKNSGVIVFVAFETVNKPRYTDIFIDASKVGFTKLPEAISSFLPTPQTPVNTSCRNVIVIDSLNHVPRAQLTKFIGSIATPHATILATLHRDMHDSPYEHGLDNYPSAIELLHFMATTSLDVTPTSTISDDDELNQQLSKLQIPRGLNNTTFKVSLTYKRKSGRELTYDFKVDYNTHQYYQIMDKKDVDENALETPEMLQGLTTFNLSTSAKQKAAKDQVELPFLEAQSLTAGGAIVYEYEKDDDYDEEDPYEDPF